MVSWDSLLVLDFGLYVLDRVTLVYLESHGLSSESSNKNLHSSPESQYKVEGRLLLNIVVTEGSVVLESFSCKDKSLLVWRYPLFVLNLSLYVFNSVSVVYLESDCLSCQSSNKNLHSSSESQYKVESRFFLNVVVGYCPSVLEGLSCEDESLLVGGDALFVLNFGFDSLDGVALSDVESHGLSGEGSYENLLHGCFLIIDESRRPAEYLLKSPPTNSYLLNAISVIVRYNL